MYSRTFTVTIFNSLKCLTLLLLYIGAVQNTESEISIDSLLPYPDGGHHDLKRTYRYVRDCLPVTKGSETHESIKPNKTSIAYDAHSFLYDFGGSRGKQFGHHAIVMDPLHMISVVEPLGTCEKRSLATVRETAGTLHCDIAINAGFFVPDGKDKGKCLGNIISSSRPVNDAGGVQNANFGIRKDGTVVIGYLSLDEVKSIGHPDNPFVQLISGVGWIIRNNVTYLDESAEAECRKTETTGSLDRFFTVQSGRSIVGYDGNGYVHLVTFDGETGKRGVNLEDVVKYLQSVGVTNAINLDGGGSTTFTINETVVNYVGNRIGNKLQDREISSILCVNGERSLKLPEKVESLSYCCNRNYLLVIGLTVLIGFSMLLHVHFFTLYQFHRSHVRRLLSGQQQKEALQSLLDAEVSSSAAETEEEFDDQQ